MRISVAALFMILTTFFLSGCGNDNMAALEDRGGNFYGPGGVLSLAGASSATNFASAPTQQAVPVSMVQSRDIQPFATARASAPAPVSNIWQWPVQGKVTESYGHKANGVANEGIVIAAAEGTPIHAAQAGEVAFVGNDTKNYGNIVILRHADGDMTSYAYAKDILVKKGDRVSAGSTIAHVGQSGSARSPQLHFAVREGHGSVDPLSKLPSQVASN